MKKIEKLFYDHLNDVNANTELAETTKARNAIDDFMEKKEGSCEELLSDLICVYGDGKEKQGFIHGFKYAFALVLETLGNM